MREAGKGQPSDPSLRRHDPDLVQRVTVLHEAQQYIIPLAGTPLYNHTILARFSYVYHLLSSLLFQNAKAVGPQTTQVHHREVRYAEPYSELASRQGLGPPGRPCRKSPAARSAAGRKERQP